MAPTSGWVGTTVTMTVTSNSFPIEGAYQILWSPSSKFDDSRTIILKEGTSPKGSLAVTNSFTIPEAPFGSYFVGFIRLGRDDPTIFSFNVLPHLTVQPVAVSPGSTVTVYGTGFPAEVGAALTFDGKSTDSNATTNQKGSFTIDFPIPNTPAGEHQLSAVPAKGTTLVSPTTVLVVPSITVAPQLPQPGNNVTVTGRGFAPKVIVNVIVNDLVMTNSPSTDDTGSFTYSFTMPQSTSTGAKLVAKDAIGNTATFSPGAKTPTQPSPSPTPTAQPPSPSTKITLSKPTPLEPREQSFGFFGAQPVKFVWTQASSFAPNTITYTLEVADNVNFTPVKPGMRASNIAQTNFILNLEPGTYYWRVKAIDAANNESEWSYSRYSFKVGIMPLWLLVIGGIVYLVILYLLIRALLRRRNRYYYY